MASFIIFFLLFLLPFVIAPFGVTQFENPKVILAEIGVIILLVLRLIRNNFSWKGRVFQLALYFCIVAVTVIDLIFFRTNISFFGNAFRMQGIFLLWILLLFSLLASGKESVFFSDTQFACRPLKNPNSLPISSILLWGIPWWVYAGLLYIELIATFFLPLNASHRYVGTLGEPNALAAFAIFVWPFGWFALSKEKKIFGSICLLIPVIVLLLLSDSHSGMVALGIQMIFCLLKSIHISYKGLWMRKQIFFCSAIEIEKELWGKMRTSKNFISSSFTIALPLEIIVIFCLILYFLSYTLPFFQTNPYENRVEVWESAFYAGMINPGIGQGFGNAEIALHNAAAGLDLPIQYYYVDSSHNIFLDWWVQGGVVGLSLLVTLIFLCFKNFIQQKSMLGLVLLFGMITVLSFNPASVVGLLGFWWVIGKGSGIDFVR